MDLFKGLCSSLFVIHICSGYMTPMTDGCTRELKLEDCLYEVYCLNIIQENENSFRFDGNNPDYDFNYRHHREEQDSCLVNSLTTVTRNNYGVDSRYYLIHMKYKKDSDSYLSSFETPDQGDEDVIFQLIYHLDLSSNGYKHYPVLKKHMPNLFSLDLSKNSLTVAMLSNNYVLTSLNELNLSYNRINTISKGLGIYTSLKRLNLSHNYLVAIPDALFDDISQLTILDLSHNFIDVLGILTFEGLKNLNTLLMAHNRLSEINDAFVRFTHLQTLDLSHNRLKYIKFHDFDKLHEIKYLNLSYNSIISVEDSVFQSMDLLKLVRLDNNSLHEIGERSFAYNSELEYVDFSKNYFKRLPNNMFHGKNITFFDISENYLEGLLKSRTFEGLNRITKLDLSNQQLTSIEDYAFSWLDKLDNLLLNRNKLQTLSYKSFKKLSSLTMLDLSDNLLSNLNFDTSDLINLRFFSLRNNIISQVPINYFNGLTSLHLLDLSDNKISKLASNSFVSLRELINLDISGNSLNGTLATDTFKDLVSLPALYISYTRLTIVQNETFSGMPGLKILNVSHGNITELQYNSFTGIKGVETIDISYNNLTTFNLNVTDLVNLKELLLSHNFLKIINDYEFNGLISLTRLDLSHNHIKSIHAAEFESLRGLRYLDISYNIDMDLNVSVISDSKDINELFLSGLRCNLQFTGLNESLISKLDLSNSSISNITVLDLRMLKNLRNLSLNHNVIQRVEVGALSKSIEELDLSYNVITFVQPGVFKDIIYLHNLNLSHNFLTTISYGVFSRLLYLEILDLSYNNLKSLESERFYEVSSLRELIVDYNNIEFISSEEFAGTSLTKLSVGGNPIPCRMISSLKRQYPTDEITALNKDETNNANVAGITCLNDDNHKPKHNESIPHDINEILGNIKDILQTIAIKSFTHSHLDNCSSNYSNYFDSITREVEKLSNFNNVTFTTLINYFSKIEKSSNSTSESLVKIFTQEVEKLSNFTNSTFTTLNNYFSKTEKSSNSTNELLVKILKSLNRVNPVVKPLQNSTNNATQFDNLINYINNVKQDLEDMITAEKVNILAEVEKKIATSNVLLTSTEKAITEKLTSDSKKTTLVGEGRHTTFTDICVWLILFILVCIVLYKFYKSRLFMRTSRSYSTRQLSGAMESPDL